MTDEEFVVQAIINRAIASAIVLMFLVFGITNLKDLIDSNASEDQIRDQVYRVISTGLGLLVVLIDLFLGIKNYINLKEEANN